MFSYLMAKYAFLRSQNTQPFTIRILFVFTYSTETVATANVQFSIFSYVNTVEDVTAAKT